MEDELTAWGTAEVFDDHLQQGGHGTVDEDLERNYASHVVVLTGAGVHRGHKGVSELAELLRGQPPGRSLYWSGPPRRRTAPASRMGQILFSSGTDRIQAQTIHYTVLPSSRQDKDRN